MREDLNGVPSGLGFNCFLVMISELSRRGYHCQVGEISGSNWIKMTKQDGFTTYFDSWADVFNFNDSIAFTIEMYEHEEEEASDNE